MPIEPWVQLKPKWKHPLSAALILLPTLPGGPSVPGLSIPTSPGADPALASPLPLPGILPVAVP